MDTGNEDFSIANSARHPSEMQTSPYYCGIIIPTGTQVHKQSYSMYSLAQGGQLICLGGHCEKAVLSRGPYLPF